MKLNRRQRKAGLIGLGVVVAMSLFPPVWGMSTFDNPPRGTDSTHRFILQSYFAIRFATLFKRFFVVGIATTGVVVFLKDKYDDAEAPPSDGG